MAQGRQAAIGAFVLGGLILGVGAIVFFSKTRLFAERRQAVIVFDGSVAGLAVGAPVTFRGVSIGSVDSIVIQYDPQRRMGLVPVQVSLAPDRVRVSTDEGSRQAQLDLATMVKRGLRAELVTQSFVTGQAEIGLDFSPDTPPVLHPGISNLPEIPTRPSIGERVKRQLGDLPLRELADSAISTLNSINKLTDQLNADLPAILDSAHHTTDSAARAMDQASAMIAGMQDKVAAALDGVNRLTGQLGQQVTQRGADLQRLLATTQQTVQQANATLTDLRGLSSARGDTRVNLDATLRDLAAAAASLRSFALDVERNPQLLITGRRP